MISTSRVERQNLNPQGQLPLHAPDQRLFKDVEKSRALVGVYFFHHNFCRIQKACALRLRASQMSWWIWTIWCA